MSNINTKKYWDDRFIEDWERKKGRVQTENFAREQIKYFDIEKDFSGSILDFGCGLGDAIPVYKENYPNAKISGVDISTTGIEKCNKRYGEIANFIAGSYDDVPEVDVIISSNVFEHLSHNIDVAKKLIDRCKKLYIIVPYKEYPLSLEHINTYDEFYFHEINPDRTIIFQSKGWTEYGMSLLKLNVVNCIKKIFGIHIKERSRQIMFEFTNKNKI